VFAPGELVQDFGKNFFAHTGLTHDQNRHIGRRYLFRNAKGMMQTGRISYDAESLFEGL